MEIFCYFMMRFLASLRSARNDKTQDGNNVARLAGACKFNSSRQAAPRCQLK